jgi:hypothetical protein
MCLVSVSHNYYDFYSITTSSVTTANPSAITPLGHFNTVFGHSITIMLF